MPLPETFRDRPYAAAHFRQIVDAARRETLFFSRWISDPEDVPLLPRAVYFQHNDEILAGRAHTSVTSGSTGRPIRFIASPDRARHNLLDDIRFQKWLGGPQPTLALIKPSSYGPLPNRFSILEPVDRQVDAILDHRARRGITSITTYSGNSELISREVLRRGLDLSFTTRFGLYTETVEPHHLEWVRRAFPRTRIWSSYSAEEVGMISGQCPFEPSFHHIMAHKLGVEVLRADGRPCADGGCGEVVITDYFNRDTPFIRYAIGDLAVRQSCPCGRISLPALGEIRRKIPGTVLHRGGSRTAFSYAEMGLENFPEIAQYQLIQESVERFTLRLAFDRPPASAREKETLHRRISQRFERYFGYSVAIVLDFVDEIPKLPSGKYQYVISRV